MIGNIRMIEPTAPLRVATFGYGQRAWRAVLSVHVQRKRFGSHLYIVHAARCPAHCLVPATILCSEGVVISIDGLELHLRSPKHIAQCATENTALSLPPHARCCTSAYFLLQCSKMWRTQRPTIRRAALLPLQKYCLYRITTSRRRRLAYAKILARCARVRSHLCATPVHDG